MDTIPAWLLNAGRGVEGGQELVEDVKLLDVLVLKLDLCAAVGQQAPADD
jgi:hypothetical protein